MKKRLAALTAACLMALCLSAPVSAASPAAGTVATASTGLNVRSAPSSSASIRTSLPKGTAVTLISRSGDWWQIRYGPDSYGYCSAAYIRELSDAASAVVATVSGGLNVRTSPSSSAAIQTSLPKGTAVTVLSTSGDWSRILYHGIQTGYVRSSYLSPGTAVSLNVPDYKQTDPRWASVTLGTSGQTMGRIGCTTTALAMTESYRLGTAVTPADMSRRLSYTAGGALYWPSHYRLLDDGTNALATIRTLLEKGVPVIYGAKTSAGRQHWVVVNGYNGRGLSAENFTILDPGSSTRTTLRQLLKDYPLFHRLAYAG